MTRQFFVFLLLVVATRALTAQPAADTVSQVSFSPFHKGAYALSGSIMYSYTTFEENDNSTTLFMFSPAFLKFTSSRFAIGGQFMYTIVKTKYPYSTARSSFIGAGPQLRLYVLQKPSLIFVSLGAVISETSTKAGDITSDGPTTSFMTFDLGTDILFTTHLSLEPYVEYRYTITGGSSAETFTFGASIVTFIY